MSHNQIHTTIDYSCIECIRNECLNHNMKDIFELDFSDLKKANSVGCINNDCILQTPYYNYFKNFTDISESIISYSITNYSIISNWKDQNTENPEDLNQKKYYLSRFFSEDNTYESIPKFDYRYFGIGYYNISSESSYFALYCFYKINDTTLSDDYIIFSLNNNIIYQILCVQQIVKNNKICDCFYNTLKQIDNTNKKKTKLLKKVYKNNRERIKNN